MKVVWVVLVFIPLSRCISLFTLVGDEWEMFKAQHGKKYENDVEEGFRKKIYLENRHKIAKHNVMYHQGKHAYSLGMNKYGDMLHQEFVKVMNGYMMRKANRTGGLRSPIPDIRGATYIGPDDDVLLPKHVDWRRKGAVTPVKDQGQCGSCWSFSATGSLEGQHYRKSGKLVSLSEQNLIDCSVKFGNNGCNGGLMDYAFAYVRANRGIDTETYYPYEAQEDKCRYNPDPMDVGATDTGFVDVESGSESSLKKAVATVGPISIAIDASHETFQFYKHGVYYEEECSPQNLDHGVLVVGYGTEESTGQDYWIVKNSWSPSWGDGGYVKMARNRDNNCGIASSASYPLV